MGTRMDHIENAICQELMRLSQCQPDQAADLVRGRGEIDSLHGLELLLALEGRFCISIEDSELNSRLCRSVSRLARLVRMKLEEQRPTGGTRNG